jgi:hypothetical protein
MFPVVFFEVVEACDVYNILSSSDQCTRWVLGRDSEAVFRENGCEQVEKYLMQFDINVEGEKGLKTRQEAHKLLEGELWKIWYEI